MNNDTPGVTGLPNLAGFDLGGAPAAGVNGTSRLLTEQEVQDAFADVSWTHDGMVSPAWMDRMNAVQRKLLEVNGLTLRVGGTSK